VPEKTTRRARPTANRDDAIDAAVTSLRRAMGATFARKRDAVLHRGVSRPQFIVLRVLSSGRASTPKELADVLCVTPGNITGLIAKLERKGFVTRERDAKDRRVVRLKLSPKAQLGLEALHRAAHEAVAKAFEGWSTDDILALQKLLDRLAGDHRPEEWKGGWGGHGPYGRRWWKDANLKAARRRQPRRP
jgi:DNA-binding MarR family transcriptional regulator